MVNRVVSFLPFDEDVLPSGWAVEVEVGVPLVRRLESDALVLGVPGSRLATLLTSSPSTPQARVATDFTIEEIAPATGPTNIRNVAIVDHFTGRLGMDNGLFLGVLDDIDDAAVTRMDILPLVNGANPGSLNFPQPPFPSVLAVGDAFDLTYTRIDAMREGVTTRPASVTSSVAFDGSGGNIGLRIRGVTARFRYVIVIE